MARTPGLLFSVARQSMHSVLSPREVLGSTGPRTTRTPGSKKGRIITSVISWPHNLIMNMVPITRIKGVSGTMQRKSGLEEECHWHRGST